MKHLIFIFFFIGSSMYAQKPEPVIQTGFDDWVTQVKYDPSGKYFAIRCKSKLTLWDAKSLLEVWSFFTSGANKIDFGFSCSGKYLVSQTKVNNKTIIKVIDLMTGKEVMKLPGGSLAINDNGHRIAFFNTNRSKRNKARVLKIYDLEKLDLEKEIQWQESRHKESTGLIFSPDGEKLFIRQYTRNYKLGKDSGYDSDVFISAFDIENEKTIWESTILGLQYGEIQVSPDGNWLIHKESDLKEIHVFSTQTGEKKHTIPLDEKLGRKTRLAFGGNQADLYYANKKIYKWDLNNFSDQPMIEELPDMPVVRYLPSYNNQIVIAENERTFNRNLFIFDSQTRKVIKQIWNPDRTLNNIYLDNKGSKIYLENAKKRYCLDLKNGLLNQLDGNWIMMHTPVGTVQYKTNSNEIVIRDVSKDQSFTFDDANLPLLFKPDSSRVISFSDPYKISGEYNRTAVLWNLETRERLFDLPLTTENSKFMTISDDYTMLATYYRQISIHKIKKNKLQTIQTLPCPDGKDNCVAHYAEFINNNTIRAYYYDKYWIDWDIKNGVELNRKGIPIKEWKYVSPDNKWIVKRNSHSFDIIDKVTFNEVSIITDHVSSYCYAAFTKESDKIATYDEFGLINYWKLDQPEEIAQVFVLPSSKHIIVLPDNYYMASPEVVGKMAFRVNGRAYPFEQFDLKYNRPDLVLERLGYADPTLVELYHKAYKKRLKKMNFTEAMLSDEVTLPEIKLLTKYLPLSTNQKRIKIEVEAEDKYSLLDRINLYVNDVPVYGKNGINLRSVKTYKIKQTLEFELLNGSNKVQVSALNQNGIESLKETFRITYTGNETKPDLYIIAIGVSQFNQSDYNLTYAAKDAQDITRTFTANKAFNRVKVLEFINTGAINQSILQAKQTLMGAKVDDMVIMFVASHGLLDESLDYYLATHDVNFNNPSVKGLLYENMEDLLDGIPPRKKLMLIDACHSGEVDKDEMILADANDQGGKVNIRGFKAVKKKEQQIGVENSFELMKELFADLRRGTGTVVISSAGGAEFAFESSEWKNGVFTYALLEGLKTGNADADKNGEIVVSELRDYVFDRVKKLTNGQQNPTSRRENLEFDFRVW